MRINVPVAQSIKIVDATGGRKGFSIQNTSAQDIFYSDDQRQLDTVTPANLPTAGHLLSAAGAPAQLPLIYPFIVNTVIFARAQNLGAQLEIIIFDVDLPCK
jgi:hypothetical protein